MILAFQKQFVEPILDGSKLHTIREDKPGRWKAGNKIHAATGVRTPQYHCFFESECVSTQKIEIVHHADLGKHEWSNVSITLKSRPISVHIDDHLLKLTEVHALSLNDGFHSLVKFFEWFDTDYKGKIIHWTDLRY